MPSMTSAARKLVYDFAEPIVPALYTHADLRGRGAMRANSSIFGIFRGNAKLGGEPVRLCTTDSAEEARARCNFYNILALRRLDMLPTIDLLESGRTRLWAVLDFVDNLTEHDKGEAQAEFFSALYHLATYAHTREGELAPEGVTPTRVRISSDWAKLSFAFTMDQFAIGNQRYYDWTQDASESRQHNRGWLPWFSGGLIYHGPGTVEGGFGNDGNGTVSLTRPRGVHTWSINT